MNWTGLFLKWTNIQCTLKIAATIQSSLKKGQRYISYMGIIKIPMDRDTRTSKSY